MTAITTTTSPEDGTQRPLAQHWRVLLDMDVAVMLTERPDSDCALECWKVLDACDRFESQLPDVLRNQDTALTPSRLLAVQQCAIHYFG